MKRQLQKLIQIFKCNPWLCSNVIQLQELEEALQQIEKGCSIPVNVKRVIDHFDRNIDLYYMSDDELEQRIS